MKVIKLLLLIILIYSCSSNEDTPNNSCRVNKINYIMPILSQNPDEVVESLKQFSNSVNKTEEDGIIKIDSHFSKNSKYLFESFQVTYNTNKQTIDVYYKYNSELNIDVNDQKSIVDYFDKFQMKF